MITIPSDLAHARNHTFVHAAKSGRIPADSCIRIPPFPQLLLDFFHLLASHLILILYYHHRVLLKYIGSLGISDSPLRFFPLLHFYWIVARFFSLVSCFPTRFPPSVSVIRGACRLTHEQYFVSAFLLPAHPVCAWAGRFWVHDVRAQYDVPAVDLFCYLRTSYDTIVLP